MTTVFGSIVALAALLHLEVEFRDLEDHATTNTGSGCGEQGLGGSCQGGNQLLHVAIVVD